MKSPAENPLNRPVSDVVADSSAYVRILKNTLRYVDYLQGDFPEPLRLLFERGSWIPTLSKIRYGLLCVALKSPEHDSRYHSFCSVLNEQSESLNLASLPGAVSLPGIRQLFVMEIERYSTSDASGI